MKCDIVFEVMPDPRFGAGSDISVAVTTCRTHGISVQGLLPVHDDLCMAGRIERLEKEMTVESTSDERTVNNTMRHQYRVLTDEEKTKMQGVKDLGLLLLEMMDAIGASRELSLAKTKIEEAVMWAVKHITK